MSESDRIFAKTEDRFEADWEAFVSELPEYDRPGGLLDPAAKSIARLFWLKGSLAIMSEMSGDGDT